MVANIANAGNGIGTGRIVRRAAMLAALAVLSVPIALWAHAHLRRSEPAANARLASSPSAIRLWFTERPELAFTRVRLRAPDSTEITLGTAARMTDDAMGVTVPIASSLAPGKYTVLWRTAAADGHASSGSFGFELAGAAPVVAAVDTARHTARSNAVVSADSVAAPSASLNASAATRWVEFMALLAVVGAVVFRLAVLPRAARAMAGTLPEETRLEIADTARRLAQSALVLLLIMTVSRLYSETRTIIGADRPVDRAALAATLGTRWGIGWSIGAAGIVIAAIGFALVRRRRSGAGWVVAAIGAAAAACSPALTGHASTTTPVGAAIVTDVAHVLAACAWLGTLLTLLFAALPLVRGARSMAGLGSGALVASLVRAFHPIALGCASVVVASGLVAAWLRLPTVASLWESSYGRVLLLKLAFVALVVVLGALNWRRLLPTLGDDRAARRITRTASAELTIAALVLAVTAVLVSTSPPESAARAATVSVKR
jgi:copper transport protein